jgi:uncharacterized phage-associated protein
MATVHDVAASILKLTEAISTMKLQKLVYYSKAWHAVWDEEELFPEAIEAWANGPVCRELYEVHRGWATVSSWPRGDPSRLRQNELESVDVVVECYGKLPAHELSALTHREAPWRDARDGLVPGERGSREITLDEMVAYYSALDAVGAVELG